MGAAPSTRASALPEELLHERVDGEWSFIETLRHLLLVHDAWLRRAVLGEPDYDPLDLPHDEMPDLEGVPHDADARPSLDQVLALREDRLAIARRFFAGLTDERLAGEAAVTGPGYPEAGSYPCAALPPARCSTRSGGTPASPSATSRPGGPGQLRRSEHHPLAGQVEGEPVGVEESPSDQSVVDDVVADRQAPASATAAPRRAWPGHPAPANVRPSRAPSGRPPRRMPPLADADCRVDQSAGR